jgi:hypothetical protein
MSYTKKLGFYDGYHVTSASTFSAPLKSYGTCEVSVTHTCNPIMWKAEIGRVVVQDQPE